jgi:hypothetical protein
MERLMFVEKQVEFVVEACKSSVHSMHGQQVDKKEQQQQQQHIGVSCGK